MILTLAAHIFNAGADLDAARACLAHSPLLDQLSGAVAILPGQPLRCSLALWRGRGTIGIVLTCNLQIALPHAVFSVMLLAFSPQPCGPARMSVLIGPARTKLILVAGLEIGAGDVLSLGLIDRTVPGDEPVDHVRMLTALFCAEDPGTLRRN